jgi:hypothetical protein
MCAKRCETRFSGPVTEWQEQSAGNALFLECPREGRLIREWKCAPVMGALLNHGDAWPVVRSSANHPFKPAVCCYPTHRPLRPGSTFAPGFDCDSMCFGESLVCNTAWGCDSTVNGGPNRPDENSIVAHAPGLVPGACATIAFDGHVAAN